MPRTCHSPLLAILVLLGCTEGPGADPNPSPAPDPAPPRGVEVIGATIAIESDIDTVGDSRWDIRLALRNPNLADTLWLPSPLMATARLFTEPEGIVPAPGFETPLTIEQLDPHGTPLAPGETLAALGAAREGTLASIMQSASRRAGGPAHVPAVEGEYWARLEVPGTDLRSEPLPVIIDLGIRALRGTGEVVQDGDTLRVTLRLVNDGARPIRIFTNPNLRCPTRVGLWTSPDLAGAPRWLQSSRPCPFVGTTKVVPAFGALEWTAWPEAIRNVLGDSLPGGRYHAGFLFLYSSELVIKQPIGPAEIRLP
jgi:hypothetical protein